MGTVCGTLTAVPPGGPVNSQDKIQFKYRLTGVPTEAAVSDAGQYALSLSAAGTYDIGVNGTYGGNTPSSIVVTSLPKYQNISSQNTKDEAPADCEAVQAAAAAGATTYRLWAVDPVDLAQFASWGSLKQFAADLEQQGYLVHVERAHFKVHLQDGNCSPGCPVPVPPKPTNDWADALIVLHADTAVASPPSTTHCVKFVGGGIICL